MVLLPAFQRVAVQHNVFMSLTLTNRQISIAMTTTRNTMETSLGTRLMETSLGTRLMEASLVPRPSLAPVLFLHTASDQKLEPRKNWVRG